MLTGNIAATSGSGSVATTEAAVPTAAPEQAPNRTGDTVEV